MPDRAGPGYPPITPPQARCSRQPRYQWALHAAGAIPTAVLMRAEDRPVRRWKTATAGHRKCWLVSPTQIPELASGIVTDNKIAPHAQACDIGRQNRPGNVQCFASGVGDLHPSLITRIKELHLLSSQYQMKIGLLQWRRRSHKPMVSKISDATASRFERTLTPPDAVEI